MKLLVCMLATVSAFAQMPTSKGVNFYSVEREIALGKVAAETLKARVSVVHDAVVDSYLESLGRELKPTDSVFEYRFVTYKGKQLDGVDEIRVLPGGTMFISLQTLVDATTDTSIATKVAHAIAHIELRHATRMDTRIQIVGNAPTSPVAIFVNDQTVLFGAQADGLPRNATTKAFEKDADKVAAVYVSKRQENTTGFEVARNAAKTALER